MRKQMNKTKVLIILLILIPIALADTFTSEIEVDSSIDGTYCQINITTEQDTETFDCLKNISDDFSFRLVRDCDSSDLTKGIDELALTCNTIANQYSGISNYFKLYNNCSIEKSLCINDKESLELELSQNPSFKQELTDCNNNLNIANNLISNHSAELSSMKDKNEFCG